MNIKAILIVAAFIILTFLIGRFTAPKKDVDSILQIDSLKRDIRQTKEQLTVALNNVKASNKRADSLYKLSLIAQETKVIYRKEYVKELDYNRSLTVLQRDSVIRAVFLPR